MNQILIILSSRVTTCVLIVLLFITAPIVIRVILEAAK